ncbi:ricin-type beta-trefoil lectin domain protein [Micromonospora sp. WMMD1076]|uniref:ricin-type beta-trefoil lectin domain protein n=1 Tax=Micromonospora sp. WMMD1076 TaxID=3016103 RepID=UPI00249CB77A|nr:ricin-type beta-trefoil lectin domain protein [Micromonospora sp. WMMD1076]WFF04603.1 ricin-type beta-trefoil lectin domain protein [Micromonospora sp. WMMD1076]
MQPSTSAGQHVGHHADLLNPQSGRCLDADGWGTANGTELIIWACGTNQSNQIWRLG